MRNGVIRYNHVHDIKNFAPEFPQNQRGIEFGSDQYGHVADTVYNNRIYYNYIHDIGNEALDPDNERFPAPGVRFPEIGIRIKALLNSSYGSSWFVHDNVVENANLGFVWIGVITLEHGPGFTFEKNTIKDSRSVHAGFYKINEAVYDHKGVIMDKNIYQNIRGDENTFFYPEFLEPETESYFLSGDFESWKKHWREGAEAGLSNEIDALSTMHDFGGDNVFVSVKSKEGGTVVHVHERVIAEVVVPEGAFSSNRRVVDIRQPTEWESEPQAEDLSGQIAAAEKPADMVSIGTGIRMQLSILDEDEVVLEDSFGSDVEVRISYRDADGDGVVDGTNLEETELKLYRLDDQTTPAAWKEIPSSVDTAGNRVNASIPLATSVWELAGASDRPFAGALEQGEGWIVSDWFGSLNVNFYPWIFHAQHEWMFVYDQSGPGSVFLFDLGLGGWLFTSSGFYPNLFSFSRNAWIFYFLDTFAPREFVDLQTGEFFSW